MQEDLSEGRPVSWLAVPVNYIFSFITMSSLPSAAIALTSFFHISLPGPPHPPIRLLTSIASAEV